MRVTAEKKVVTKLIEGISTLDFQPGMFALHLGTASIRVQERVLECLMEYIDFLSLKWDEELFGDHEADLCMKAKRMQDAMAPFR